MDPKRDVTGMARGQRGPAVVRDASLLAFGLAAGTFALSASARKAEPELSAGGAH
jgi:hypothetical protein